MVFWNKKQYVSEYARSHRHIQGFYIGFVNVYIDTQCYINMGSLCPIQTLTEILSYVGFFLRYLRTKQCLYKTKTSNIFYNSCLLDTDWGRAKQILVVWLPVLYCSSYKVGKSCYNALLRDHCSWKYFHTSSKKLPKLIGHEIHLQFPWLLNSSTPPLVSCLEYSTVHESIASSPSGNQFQDLKACFGCPSCVCPVQEGGLIGTVSASLICSAYGWTWTNIIHVALNWRLIF